MSKAKASTTDNELSSLLARLDAAESTAGFPEIRARSYDLLRLQADGRALDVGCGGGRAVEELAGLTQHAVGIDPDKSMIRAARYRWPQRDFLVANAYQLPFLDNSFHAYRAEKMFHELADPARALAEASRVLSPNGRIALAGHDWDLVAISGNSPELTRKIVHARADVVTNPRIARNLRALLLDARFTDVSVEMHGNILPGATALGMLREFARTALSTGDITINQYEKWMAEQHERSIVDRLLVAVPIFIVSGTHCSR